MKLKKPLLCGLSLLLTMCVACGPTSNPTSNPTVDPTTDPTVDPTLDPTTDPTVDPTVDPTTVPTVDPTVDPTTEPSTEPSTEPTVPPNPYGELMVPDMRIYTSFPDVPFPSFSDPTYESDITYTVLDNADITYSNGYFSASKAGRATVEAKTQYHTTTFTVEAVQYADAKGQGTTDWYLSRVSSVESRWINDGKPQNGTLFIGDSFFDTEFWSDFYQLYGETNNVYSHGVSSSTTTDWEIFSKRLVYPANPANIVMHLGTNNLYDDRESSETAIANTQKLLAEFEERLPETKVYYFAIEPRTYGIGGGAFTESTYNTINAVNTAMKSYCEEKENVIFVDATPYCYTEGITVNESFFRDGTHPKLENYLKYAELLKTAGLDLTIDTSYLNTTEFSFPQTTGVANTNHTIRKNGKVLTNEYSVKGKLKIGDNGNNPHIQFSLDETNFQNRFLLWDQDGDGNYVSSYAHNQVHMHAAGKASVRAGEEVEWEVVTTKKHSYFYVNGELEFIFLNINAKTLLIGGEKVAAEFYDIEAVTADDAEAYARVLAREEIAKYEASTETEGKAIKYVNTTTGFKVAKTNGVASTNQQILVEGNVITHNYSVKGKLVIGENDNNPHIQFSLDGTNFQNRFLLWDNDTNGTYQAAYAFGGSHKAGSGKAVVKAGEVVEWEVVTTEKNSYFYVNGELEFVFLNLNSRSLDIGGEKVAFEAYDIETITKDTNANAWNEVLNRFHVSHYEAESNKDTTARAVKHSPITTSSFSVAKTAGVAATNKQIYRNDEMITNNYSVKGKLVIGENDNNPHIQFSLDGTNFNNRFLLWDNDTNGTYQAAYAFGGSHKAGSGNAVVKAGEVVEWEVVTSEKHSYFYVNGELEFVFLNINSTSLDIGGEKVAFEAYDIVTVTAKHDADAWTNVLARPEIAKHEALTETEAKAFKYESAETKSFSVAKTVGVANTNRQIWHKDEMISYNYSVKGKLVIGENDNNPHIQFSLDGKNFNNRFLLWDNDTNGTYQAAYACNGSHKAGSGNAVVKAGEVVEWEVVVTEKHAYFYVNNSLEFVFLNINSRSLDIGGEKVAFEAYDIVTVTAKHDADAWANVLARQELVTYEASEETALKAVVI